MAALGGPEPNGAKDAVHVGIIRAVSEKPVLPGQVVTLEYDAGGVLVASSLDGKPVSASAVRGVVDPFLETAFVIPGDLFWVALWPGSTGNIRHVFDIDNLPEPEAIDPEGGYYSDSCSMC